ncbi:hypothetical protein [Mesorhizobium sp. CAU 1741]|uniref:hypothetical protein n=1 Tax=Mesorhizobium sp. CAU 1741 TaxID=3140366 RepID=UPI00325BD88E
MAAVALALAAYWAGDFTDPQPDTINVSSTHGDNDHYQLRSSEQDGACTLSLGVIKGARQALSPDAACTGVNADVSTARWWQERPDGSVALLRSDGGLVAEFAVADGAAFESYNPVSPILVLLSEK